MWWHTPVILTFWRVSFSRVWQGTCLLSYYSHRKLRQEDCQEFNTSLDFIVSNKTNMAVPCGTPVVLAWCQHSGPYQLELC